MRTRTSTPAIAERMIRNLAGVSHGGCETMTMSFLPRSIRVSPLMWGMSAWAS